MKSCIISLLIIWQLSLSGQTYSYDQVKDSAFSHLEQEIGKELSSYFQLSDKNMFYSYRNWLGNTRSRWLNPEDEIQIKGLKKISLLLEFHHPDLDSLDLEISYLLNFNEKLNTTDSFKLFEIPAFIREKRACDWISREECAAISDTLDFKYKPLNKHFKLKFDSGSREYYWVITSITKSSDPHYQWMEYFWLNAHSGKLERHILDYTRRANFL